MSYYTEFSLSIIDYGDDFNAIKDELNKEIGKFDCDHLSEEEWFCYAKWYDYEEDMLRLSEKFPNVVFTLKGIGEEHDDMWVEYFKNGKCKYSQAEIVFQKYDEKDLR